MLGKTLVKDREWKPIQISQIPIFFDFSKNLFSLKITKHLKTNKIDLLALKTLLKTCLKHWRSQEILALKILAKIPKKWGFYRPIRKLAVRLSWQPDRLPVGRPDRPPTVRNVTVGQTRSTARSTQTNREQSSQLRSTVRVDRPCVCQTCTALCTSVDLTGRPALGTVDPCGRPTWPVSHNLGQKTHVKNISKKNLKNVFIILHWYINMW